MLWFLLTAGCVKPGPVSMAPVGDADPSVIADIAVSRTADLGWQLVASLVLKNPDPTQRRRMDLSRADLRADGGTWERCHHAADVEKEQLMVVLEPAEEKLRTLRCVEMIEPRHALSIRIPATLADSGSGVVILEYERVDR